ncbi:MAG: FliH/SctL family protein [Anaerolineae bacterium]|nr:FliH/SctL family protein [Anaerolineae bacterium]MDW8099720.1 FliH/SctL family protein [Anaerolineae bacterium]
MSSARRRTADPPLFVSLLLPSDTDEVGKPPPFRPFFPEMETEVRLTPADGTEGQAEQELRTGDQQLADEWVARLAEVDQVLRQAHQRAEALAKQAEAEGYEAGYRRGYDQGLELARHALDQEVAHVRSIAQALAQARRQMLESLEGEVVALALAIARKVIGEEAAHNEQVIIHMVQRAVRQLGQRGPYRIRLSPRDAQRLSERWKAQDDPGGVEWELVPDERIAPGGCILESGAATVDARLETQLDLVQKALLGDREVPSIQGLLDEFDDRPAQVP